VFLDSVSLKVQERIVYDEALLAGLNMMDPNAGLSKA